MRLVVQRSLDSSVTVDGKITGKISSGLVVLVGFTHTDTEKDIDYLIKKLVNLRIFDDENHIMNRIQHLFRNIHNKHMLKYVLHNQELQNLPHQSNLKLPVRSIALM